MYLSKGSAVRFRFLLSTNLDLIRVCGSSWQTLYRRCAGAAGPCITVVRDLAGYVFGAYTSLPWRVQPSFYGNGETFVFQLKVPGLDGTPLGIEPVCARIFQALHFHLHGKALSSIQAWRGAVLGPSHTTNCGRGGVHNLKLNLFQ